jgi:hypothetical protein
VREVLRWKSLIVPAKKGDGGVGPSRLRVEVHGIEGTPDPTTTVFEVANEAAAGVVVRRGKSATELFVGEPRNGSWTAWDSPLASSRAYFDLHIPVHFAAEAGLPLAPAEGVSRGRPDEGTVRFELLLPGIGVLSSAAPHAEIKLRVGELGTEPGRPIQLTLGMVVHDAARSFGVDCDLETFVRDTL